MTVPSDYIGRRVDAMAFQGVLPAGEARLTMALGDASGSVCTGIEKLAQRWVIAFLQDRGSQTGRAAAGSSFMPRAKAGLLRTELDVRQAFSIAADEVARQLQDADADTDPEDERLAGSALLGIGIFTGGLSLSVRVVSRAGTSRVPILPIRLSP